MAVYAIVYNVDEPIYNVDGNSLSPLFLQVDIVDRCLQT
jgi:hypothetical protein